MLRALLTNIRAIAGNHTVNATKEPFFDKKWGNNAGFKKNIDKASYEILCDDSEHQALINDQILVMYKTKLSDSRSRFLSRMASDSLDFIEDQKNQRRRQKQEELLCNSSMTAMIDHVYEVIKAYSYELNNALGFGPLHVAATNPQTVTEIVKFNKLRQAEETLSYYRARLSTNSHSLVMRGDKNGIQFYVIPVARVIGLSKQEEKFLPAFKICTRLVNGTVIWETDGGAPLTSSRLEVICMNLFQRLIDDTKAQVVRDQQSQDMPEREAVS
ncbi:MAG: hypothetical protein K2X77_19825 [Candidatus Obscuribacterales bacterium]|jgi:hypothetical protein|nr:hypothetical protein [Candidatus Obscuribacterales bacterium]